MHPRTYVVRVRRRSGAVARGQPPPALHVRRRAYRRERSRPSASRSTLRRPPEIDRQANAGCGPCFLPDSNAALLARGTASVDRPWKTLHRGLRSRRHRTPLSPPKLYSSLTPVSVRGHVPTTSSKDPGPRFGGLLPRDTGTPVRCFAEFAYPTRGSWTRERHVVATDEATPMRARTAYGIAPAVTPAVKSRRRQDPRQTAFRLKPTGRGRVCRASSRTTPQPRPADLGSRSSDATHTVRRDPGATDAELESKGKSLAI